MTDHFSDTIENLKRQAYRIKINKIWNRVKEDKFTDLNQKEQELAIIMMNHQEYQEYFENEDLLDGSEHKGNEGFNPFLHISLHQMAEDQVASETPVEAALLCEYIERMGYSRHEGLHVIMTILINMIMTNHANNKPFDEQRYRRLLEKCRKVKPSEMQDVVKRELTSS